MRGNICLALGPKGASSSLPDQRGDLCRLPGQHGVNGAIPTVYLFINYNLYSLFMNNQMKVNSWSWPWLFIHRFVDVRFKNVTDFCRCTALSEARSWKEVFHAELGSKNELSLVLGKPSRIKLYKIQFVQRFFFVNVSFIFPFLDARLLNGAPESTWKWSNPFFCELHSQLSWFSSLVWYYFSESSIQHYPTTFLSYAFHIAAFLSCTLSYLYPFQMPCLTECHSKKYTYWPWILLYGTVLIGFYLSSVAF